jgi:type I restriction enzyme, S subunit
MIEDLVPYSDYQTLDSRWIPRAPAHWHVKKLRALTTPRSERNRPDLPLLSVARERGVFVRTGDDDNHNFVPDDLSNYKIARAGALVINKMKAWQGSMGIAPMDGIVSPAYFVYDLRITNCMFGQALLRSRPYVAHFAWASDGVRVGQWDLSIDRMREIPVLLPPPDEQAAIVGFLDHASRRIEQFIRAKKKLIALFNEQKQSIIHRAVTRGLDPNVTFKESGVPWVNEIPAHWQLTPNRTHLRVRKVLVGDRHREYRLLSLTKRGVIIRDLSENRGKFSSDMGTSQEVRAGDLVFCLFDVPETPRTVGLSSHDGMITGAYTVVECSDLSIARFLEVFYIAMDDSKLLSPLYSGLRNTIPKDRLLGAKTPTPPAGEREGILSFIAKETRALQAGIDRTSAEIALVQEYRSRLVADVVTGQLDVRAAAASLPAIEPEAALTGPEVEETDIEDGEAA